MKEWPWLPGGQLRGLPTRGRHWGSGEAPQRPEGQVARTSRRIRKHKARTRTRIGATGTCRCGGGGCRGPERTGPTGPRPCACAYPQAGPEFAVPPGSDPSARPVGPKPSSMRPNPVRYSGDERLRTSGLFSRPPPPLCLMRPPREVTSKTHPRMAERWSCSNSAEESIKFLWTHHPTNTQPFELSRRIGHPTFANHGRRYICEIPTLCVGIDRASVRAWAIKALARHVSLKTMAMLGRGRPPHVHWTWQLGNC